MHFILIEAEKMAGCSKMLILNGGHMAAILFSFKSYNVAPGTCAYLSGLHCHLGHWWHPDPVAGEDHVWVCAEVHVPYCHQKSHKNPRLELQPEALVSGSHLGTRTIQSEWPVLPSKARMSIRAQAATQGHVWVCSEAAVGPCHLSGP